MPRRDKELDGRVELLELVIDDLLRGRLGDRARDVGLDTGQLRRGVLGERVQQLATTDAAWRRFSNARQVQRDLELGFQRGEWPGSYFLRMLLVSRVFPWRSPQRCSSAARR